MRRHYYWIGFLGLALVLSLVWGFSERSRAERMENIAENQYHRALNDLVANLDGMEMALAKSKTAASPVQQVYHLSQTWNRSETAVKNLAGLPAEEVGMGYVEQLLNQVGEYTQMLTRKVTNGQGISEEEEKVLDEMHNRVMEVNKVVQNIYTSVNTESLAWLDKRSGFMERLGRAKTAEAAAEGNEGSASPKSVRSGLDQLNASLQKLPPITYEGQTDVHSVPEPLGLPDKTVDQSASKLVAQDFLRRLDITAVDLQQTGASQGPLGGFIWGNDQASVEVSKRGGVVTFYHLERELGERKLEGDEATKAALTNLKKLGWDNMVLTSIEDFGSYLRLEAVPEINKVRFYPDKIRFSVAKDNGQIIDYDASAYYAYHHNRQLNQKLTLEQAKARLRSGFKVSESRLAVIPKSGRQEAFCYEFRGMYKDEEYLIYINAATGAEEDILRIIKTPRGEYLQ